MYILRAHVSKTLLIIVYEHKKYKKYKKKKKMRNYTFHLNYTPFNIYLLNFKNSHLPTSTIIRVTLAPLNYENAYLFS